MSLLSVSILFKRKYRTRAGGGVTQDGIRCADHLEAGKANLAISDADVLDFAAQQGRVLLTYNRKHFLALHNRRVRQHTGLVLLTFDVDFARQARRISDAIANIPDMSDQAIRVNRPNF